MENELSDFLTKLGIKSCQNLIVHSSFRKIKKAFPGITIEGFISSLREILSTGGSLIFPAFTYCFKKNTGEYEIFDKSFSPAKTGAIADVFRTMPGVTRTSSPTHSFSVWGKISDCINESNSPESPLGKGSVLDWLALQKDSYVLMAGVNFSSLSFGHYLEIMADVPWSNYSPWNYLAVEPVGVSIDGEQNLIEIPGCAKSFVAFEEFLKSEYIIQAEFVNNVHFYLIPIEKLIKHGLKYFSENHEHLLCLAGTCSACESRHHKFNI